MVVVLLALVVGCRPGGAAPEPGPTPSVSVAEARSREQRVLDERAHAVRTRDLRLFLASVDRTDPALVRRQRRYFHNLVQLPLERFRYRVLPSEWPGPEETGRWGEHVRVPEVQLSLQLREYDAMPVRRTVGFVFSYRGERPVIVADSDAGGSPLVRGGADPWDLTAISVRRRGGVLGIFDRTTRRRADTVMTVVARGIEQLRAALPFTWDEHVVVYHVAEERVLASFTDVPGGALAALGAMTFPAYTGPTRDAVASTRMLLMTSSVLAGEPFLGRITRHELSHVALGKRDDGAPTWLSEGLAEYLGAREIPQRQRIIATSALERATNEEAGLPPTAGFNGRDQEWHYALSWMACDYVASSRGEAKLWELVDALHADGHGTRDDDQDTILRRVLGFDGRELARRAQARIRSIYG